MKKTKFTKLIKGFQFAELFNLLGWNNFNNQIPITIKEQEYQLVGIAQKRTFAILQCPHNNEGEIPKSNLRKQIERKLTKYYHEHLIIYTNKNQTRQIWQLVIKEPNKPKQVREINWYSHQDTEILFQRLKNLFFTLNEEENITIVDVKQRFSENFAKNTEKVTKKFYTEFKKQHTTFLDFINGIDDHISNKENTNKQWYASLMLNRLMFCYFIQKRGFLDQNHHYLQEKLLQTKEIAGDNNFYSFYRTFLLQLFHNGLGKQAKNRPEQLHVKLGKIPYLNGGLFDVHKLENDFAQIKIKDQAFKHIFDFFDQWNWHLDTNVEATGRDINPDVIGFIFEKYINDRANMGAYYTKEDITDYIGRNTIIPFLFDETKRNYSKAFKPDTEIWQTLKNSNNNYIYQAVKKGIPSGEKHLTGEKNELFADLPQEIKDGFKPELENNIITARLSDASHLTEEKHLWQIRKQWNKKAPEEIALPTETYRELIERRKRYANILNKIENGEINEINDFITYNLDIRQFAQHVIENSEDPEFIKHFFKAIKKVTILDPTCGSGAFLFAAMNILEPLYEACINRMEQFVADEPRKHKFFNTELAKINSEEHPNLQYYIFKSIILNNLHGVDIMNEAVEIAKLRLFLKLVATVELNPRKENYGLEPLPDIDFNIRAGNTLVGFATEKELFNTLKGQLFSSDGVKAEDKLEELKEDMKIVSTAYKHFQNAQLLTDHNSESHRKAKNELNQRLNQLNQKLNHYLAKSYGRDAEKLPKEYNQWLETHQPFHWFAEFYDIIEGNGGFDVIIGNPPYVEYSKVKKSYKILNYKTIKCSNLYAFVTELGLSILKNNSFLSLIIPISLPSTDRMNYLRNFLKSKSEFIYNSYFADRPGTLFSGVHQKVNITTVKKSRNKCKQEFSTNFLHWYSKNNENERKKLFNNFHYQKNDENNAFEYWLKIGNKSEKSIIEKIQKQNENVYNILNRNIGQNKIYLNMRLMFWAKSFLKSKKSREYKNFGFSTKEKSKAMLCVLNSSLFFYFWEIIGDCWHLTKKDLLNFHLSKNILNNIKLAEFGEKLENDLEEKKIYVGTVQTDYEYYHKLSKTIIDEIDTVLASHYGFTELELDFIINYDIKYRMGKELANYIEK